MQQQGPILAAAAIAALVVGFLLWRVGGRVGWRATVTPLASIIGSGFLIAAPLLVGTFGGAAIWGMAALLLVAYALGHVIRFNIRHAEPLLADRHHDRQLGVFEGLSDAALTFAYFISVAYYLALLGAFLLKGFGVENMLGARWITTAILLFIGALGIRGGLRAVERVETAAVGLKLAIIAALCAALLVALLVAEPGRVIWPDAVGFNGGGIAVLLGMLIVCQGFETSRYLGAAYSPAVRIRSMRNAQLISAAIYLSFFALITPFLGGIDDGFGVTALVDVAGEIAIVLAAAVTIGAASSQFTAAVADSIASTGLMHEVSRGRLAPNLSYFVLVPVAIVVVWFTNVTELVSYASRAFAVYYALQCAVAVRVAFVAGGGVDRRSARMVAYAAIGLVAAAVAVFGAPVSE